MEIRKTIVTPNKREAMKVGNLVFRSSYDFRITEEDLKQAYLELGETEEKRTTSLLKLKEALIRDKDFYYRLDDEYLLRFLRHRKFDVQRTYASIRKFYDFRKERPDLFEISSTLDYYLTKDLVKLLPYRTEQGYCVLWVDFRNVNETSIWEYLPTLHAVSDVLTMHPFIQVNGMIGIWDVKMITASHVAQISHPRIIKILLHSLQTFYPWRIKRIIVFNCHALLRAFYAAFRYLLSKKIADRVVLLGSDVNELRQYLNPCTLPKEYGGCVETAECSIIQHVKDNLPYIEYERSFGTNTKVPSNLSHSMK